MTISAAFAPRPVPASRGLARFKGLADAASPSSAEAGTGESEMRRLGDVGKRQTNDGHPIAAQLAAHTRVPSRQPGLQVRDRPERGQFRMERQAQML